MDFLSLIIVYSFLLSSFHPSSPETESAHIRPPVRHLAPSSGEMKDRWQLLGAQPETGRPVEPAVEPGTPRCLLVPVQFCFRELLWMRVQRGLPATSGVVMLECHLLS